jgi:D-aminopeptidase
VINEFGFLMGPIALTNSFNVYRVADALQDWSMDLHPEIAREQSGLICVVAECADDYLNDARGRHVQREAVFQAIETASGGMPAEGSVGGGTGDVTFGFKGGIGTASRLLPAALGGYTVATLVQSNFGIRENLHICGVPVGRELLHWQPEPPLRKNEGSCVMVIATDAPLSSRQLRRIARRAFLGQARTGGVARNGSGDLAIAFSTAQRIQRDAPSLTEKFEFIPDFREDTINALFQATTDVVEEAILNSLFASDTMTGRDDNIVYGLPLPEVAAILRKYGFPLVEA